MGNKKTDEWKLVAHSHQIADTGDYSGSYEITNGKISIITQDDDDQSLEPVVKALNDSGCKFYIDDSPEFEIHILKEENKRLWNENEELKKTLWKKLAEKIFCFVEKYAGISPRWTEDNGEDKFTSPDAYEMISCGNKLDKGIKPEQCHSEWGSGGYKPYTSDEGKVEHDNLVKEIYKIINS